jgi:hypothetical protein
MSTPRGVVPPCRRRRPQAHPPPDVFSPLWGCRSCRRRPSQSPKDQRTLVRARSRPRVGDEAGRGLRRCESAFVALRYPALTVLALSRSFRSESSDRVVPGAESVGPSRGAGVAVALRTLCPGARSVDSPDPQRTRSSKFRAQQSPESRSSALSEMAASPGVLTSHPAEAAQLDSLPGPMAFQRSRGG